MFRRIFLCVQNIPMCSVLHSNTNENDLTNQFYTQTQSTIDSVLQQVYMYIVQYTLHKLCDRVILSFVIEQL